MAEILECLVKKCNNKNYKNVHLCKKHFYQLSKDQRKQVDSMRLVCDIGQIDLEKYFYFVRGLCITMERSVGFETVTVVISAKNSTTAFETKKANPTEPLSIAALRTLISKK